jgi:hypothetical protein
MLHKSLIARAHASSQSSGSSLLVAIRSMNESYGALSL